MAHCTLAPRSQRGALSPLKRLRGTLAGEKIGNQLCGRCIQTPQQHILRVVAPCTHCVDFTTGVSNAAVQSLFITVAGALWRHMECGRGAQGGIGVGVSVSVVVWHSTRS
ncbi:uncharacterized protein ZBAI_03585 [Zygosaccharomyces bailii ISA1307]|nr:uncharacterized protein ZBAI_03585 [Zygosaccharomyces bailii ISA1307]